MSTDAQKMIEETKALTFQTYTPQPVIMDRGEGVYAYDTDGKKYLDFAIGFAVAGLGHAHPKILKTINEQASKMMICQSSYVTKPKYDCAKLLIENTCFDQVYFSNSGTESNEIAIKTARKWAYDNKSQDCNEIIAFHGGFHGRTYGSASVTYKCELQPYFAPYVGGVHFANFNDLASVEALISDKTAGIIIELIQGEGGLVPADPAFIKGLRKLCDDHKIVLIFDEVQTGIGRLGTFMSHESFGVEPDIATFAKAMGGGFPVGCTMAKNEFAKAIVPGTHGTTYGGNPLACAVAHTVLGEILSDGFLENVRKVSEYLMDGLKELQRESNKITDIRGIGLMIGMNTTVDIKQMVKALQKNGFLATQAGTDTLRLLPPLIITEEHAQEAIDIIAKTLQEED